MIAEELLRLGLTNNAVAGFVEGSVFQAGQLTINVYGSASEFPWAAALVGVIVGGILMYIWMSRTAQVYPEP
ncbi:hypothetical protein [Kutzneria sp. 744]|uniref:hypothetical protein n=1 Tax=Kutzneria sp. (strain 744) TaxID=345341 RepID=UPI0004B6406A|nr:hypothetical protein [Kutzneria sp. 744]